MMTPFVAQTLPDFASNLRRLMARQGWSLAELVLASGLNERTIRGILNGTNKPHSRTLQRLAETFSVSADELFQDPTLLAHRLFDRQSNPLVEEVITQNPTLFRGWTEVDYDSLYSRFGTGGALTREGAICVAKQINQQREILEKTALILETDDADVLVSLVEVLYARVVLQQPAGFEKVESESRPL
jgi:transcriptional regulator with XRE-family HTH domain